MTSEEQNIANMISNMMNGVTEMEAYNDLNKLMKKMPTTFTNPKLFHHVIILLSVHRFKPKVRKFIFNLFEHVIFGDMITDTIRNEI